MNAFYVWLGNEQKGPFSAPEVQALVRGGLADGTTQIRPEGADDWYAISEIKFESVAVEERPPSGSIPEVRIARESKSQAAYCVLAIFFGQLGVHNFYAGQVTLGAIKLGLTLVFCFTIVIPVVMWIWAIVEVCTTNVNGEEPQPAPTDQEEREVVVVTTQYDPMGWKWLVGFGVAILGLILLIAFSVTPHGNGAPPLQMDTAKEWIRNRALVPGSVEVLNSTGTQDQMGYRVHVEFRGKTEIGGVKEEFQDFVFDRHGIMISSAPMASEVIDVR
jgi:TM2 domain-containing membrane protein YozV